MELQTAKYYQEPEATAQPEFATFSKPGDHKMPPASSEPDVMAKVVISCSLGVMLLSWYASAYAAWRLFDVPIPRGRFMRRHHQVIDLLLRDYCKTSADTSLTYAVSSGLVVAALLAIGCVHRNRSSIRACGDSAFGELALMAGEHLRGTGRNAFPVATAYLVGGTIVSVAGITWMITLFQEQEPASVSLVFMTLLMQVGIASSLGGAFSLLVDRPAISPQQAELAVDDPAVSSK